MENQNLRLVPQPHEQRVINECNEVLVRTNKLYDFIHNSEIFKTLPPEEQFLMKAQLFHMQQYSAILNERIYLFDKTKEPMPLTEGQKTIGLFGTEKEEVFSLKYISMLMIDATNLYGKDPRRNAIVRTDMEKTQMMAVKSIFG